jgi:hypothetical protein
MLLGGSANIKDVAPHLIFPSPQVRLLDYPPQLLVVLIVLAKIHNLTYVHLQQEEQDCSVVFFLLWLQTETQSSYDFFLMEEYIGDSFEKILVFCMVGETNFEGFLEGIDELFKV